MSLKALKAEIKRIAEKVGADEGMVVLIVLATVNCSKKSSDLPESVGHIVDYRIAGVSVPLYFPFSQMNSSEAEEMAKLMISHVISTERTGIRPQIGIMETRPLPPLDAWLFQRPPEGVSLAKYIAEQYQQILEARDEHP
jgi:hypothetical protein